MSAGRFRSKHRPSQGDAAPAGRLVAVDGSAFAVSAAGLLAARAAAAVPHGRVVALPRVDAEALLGRRRHPSVADAVDAVGRAEALVLATPLYRGTYSGLTKAFFDQLPPGLLDGVPCLVVAVGDALPPAFAGEVERLVDAVGGHLHGPPHFVRGDDVDLETGPAPWVARQLDEEVARLLSP